MSLHINWTPYIIPYTLDTQYHHYILDPHQFTHIYSTSHITPTYRNPYVILKCWSPNITPLLNSIFHPCMLDPKIYTTYILDLQHHPYITDRLFHPLYLRIYTVPVYSPYILDLLYPPIYWTSYTPPIYWTSYIPPILWILFITPHTI